MNQTLLSEFTADEVKHALFQMHPSKALGPDGMSLFFFQKYWDVVGCEVTAAVLDFLRTGRLLPKLNFMHVAFISKVKDPTNMTQLHPISLCNVIYKIGAKVLANCLKLILNDVIGVHQSAFVLGCMIFDNSIVAFEVLHHMHNRTHDECQQLSYIFQSYERASRQRINLQKSCISFSSNVEMSRQQALAQILGVQRVDKHDKYLGIPTFIGRSRNFYFALLKERVWKKQAMAKYWWGETEDKRKIHWMSWNRLCKPKREGGMGFRNLYAFNMALLAKQDWRIYHQPHSLLARVLKARYHKDYSILEASEGHAPSYIWRSLCDSRVITSATVAGHENALVCELIDLVLHKWCEDLVHAWFGAQEAYCILHLPLSFRSPADRLVWHYEKQGDLTVHSAYKVPRQFLFEEAGEGSSNRDNYYGVSTKAWSRLWRVCVPPMVKVFVWRVLHNILPTRDRLLSKGVQGDLGGYVLCGAREESLPHVLLDCSFRTLMLGE
ncbi:PREDICTED: uncharacterized protein LOC107880293 [Prunus mume]|uniref:Uncharacterized protein LOC107880293 n=1 Tax=Prunus mume TaxID=102107 RepID=A0ABM1LI28_PRUMU|nr:PREDICTED: uncharacterized protein LOC107880293 [Prunus mume]